MEVERSGEKINRSEEVRSTSHVYFAYFIYIGFNFVSFLLLERSR